MIYVIIYLYKSIVKLLCNGNGLSKNATNMK